MALLKEKKINIRPELLVAEQLLPRLKVSAEVSVK
jgi:hypothetical protein